MERKEFEKIVRQKRNELEKMENSSNLYSVGFSNGMLSAYELLSKEQIGITGKEPDFGQAISELVKNAAILDSVIVRLNESVNKLK